MNKAMQNPRRSTLAIAVLLLAGVQAAWAQGREAGNSEAYPDKTIRIIAPSSPGGGIDVLARFLGAKLTESWGKTVVVDNRPGAGGIIGTSAVAQASPDGYTLLLIAGGYTLNPSLYKKLPYDTMNDFERISLLACAPNMLVVHASIPVKSVGELVAYARSRPDGLTFGSSGIGTTSYLSAMLFQQRAKLQMVHVPYKGAGLSNKAMLAGEVNMLFSAPHEMVPYAREGRVKPLAVTSSQRLPLVADVPTLAEAGFPGFEVNTCYGMLAPAKTPTAIIEKLSRKLANILETPDVRKQLESLSFTLIGSTPQAFTDWARKDLARWSTELREAGIQPE